MKDSYGRTIDYMRISVTDRCNLRCKYCMPEGIRCVPSEEILTLEEICQVAACGGKLGIRHIRITGGEPLVRKNCCHLVRQLKGLPGIEKVTITTNGMLLKEHLEDLVEGGIDGINISMDTRDRQRFREITGSDGAEQVLESIRLAAAQPVAVKVNAVSLDLGEENLVQMAELAREYPVDVRFIEMMPIGYGKAFPVMDHGKLLERLGKLYPGLEDDPRVHGSGPAVYYRIPGFKGSIGLISAIHGKFCDRCNRVRLTSQGQLKTCLCYEDGADLRAILRGEEKAETRQQLLLEAIRQAVEKKPAAHCFDCPGQITEQRSMVMIGG